MRSSLIILFTLILGISTNAQVQTKQLSDDYLESSVTNPDRLSILLSDVLVRRLSVEYERVFSNGNISLNIPVSVTLSPFEDLWSAEVHWWFGLGVKFYPTGQGVVRYFLGPEFRFISASEINYNWYYDDYGNYIDNSSGDKYLHTAFLINNGLVYSPTDEFFVGLNMGLGFLSRSPDSGREVLVPFATPSFRLGFKF